jgi:hypothetical protein
MLHRTELVIVCSWPSIRNIKRDAGTTLFTGVVLAHIETYKPLLWAQTTLFSWIWFCTMLKSYHKNWDFSDSVVLEKVYLLWTHVKVIFTSTQCWIQRWFNVFSPLYTFWVVTPPDTPTPPWGHDFNTLDSALCPEASMWIWTFLTEWISRGENIKMVYIVAPPNPGGHDFMKLYSEI